MEECIDKYSLSLDSVTSPAHSDASSAHSDITSADSDALSSDCGDHDDLCSDHDHLESDDVTRDDQDPLRLSHRRYRECAQAAQQAVKSGRVQRAWVKTLEALPRDRVYRVRKWKFAIQEPSWSQDATLDRVFRSTHGTQLEAEGNRGKFASPLGDQLFDLVMHSIVEAAVKPTQLDLCYDTCGQSLWDHFIGYQSDALSELETLLFRPWLYGITPDGEYFRPEDDDSHVTENAAFALTSMLNICNSSLRFLSINNRYPIVFPAEYINQVTNVVPELRRLEMKGVHLNAKAFASWLRQCTKVEHLSIASTILTTDGYYGWRLLFDAIRDHPNRMTVEFHQIMANQMITLGLHTAEFVEVSLENEWGDGYVSICGYLSGSCDWNASLDEMFG